HRAILQIPFHPLNNNVTALLAAHVAKAVPIFSAPPTSEFFEVSLARECAFKPPVCKEVELFYFVPRLLVPRKFFHGCPLALKGTLIEKAKGSFVFRDPAICENFIDSGVEIAAIDVDVTGKLASFGVAFRLRGLQGFQTFNLRRLRIAKMEM